MVMSPVLQELFDQGQPFVISAGKKKADGSRVWYNELHDNLDTAEARLRQWAKGRYNTYVKFATFDGATRDHNGKPVPLCTLEHVVGSRTFFVDLDCGDGKGYATVAEARAALDLALADLDLLGIPRPNLLQETGNGLQAAWVVDRVFGVNEWKIYNGILYGMLKERGVKADPAASAPDRGVRMCGSEFPNTKGQGAKPTRVVYMTERIPARAWMEGVLPHRMRAVPGGLGPTPDEVRREYGVGDGGSAPFEFHIADVVPHCEVLKDADATAGAGHGFAVWSDVVALCARDADQEAGAAWAHYFSGGHAGYDPALVDRKLDSYRQTGSALVTCARFEDTFPEACGRCRFKGKVKSCGGIPKVLRGTAHDPLGELPGNYLNKAAGLYVRTPDGEDLIWAGHNVTTVELFEDAGNGTIRLSFTVNGGRQVSVDMKRAYNTNAMQKHFGEDHRLYFMSNGEVARVHRAMTSWVTELRRKQQVQQHYSHLGWIGGEFVLGGTVYSPSGPRSFRCTDPYMLEFQPAGDHAVYAGILATVLSQEPRPEMHALFVSGFAGPLVELAGGTGMSLNFFSPESGFGKSLMGRLSASGIGNPNAPMVGGSDTHNSVFKKMATLHSLSLMFDDPEVNQPTKQYRSYVANASRGAEKQRLTSDAKMQDHGSWKTMLVFLSNTEFSGMIDSGQLTGDATAARFLEFRVTPLTNAPAGKIAEFIHLGALLDKNYGFLGPVYIDHVVRRQDAIRARLKELTGDLMHIGQAHPGDASGRFQAMAGACLMAAAEICQDFTPVDAAKVFEVVCHAVERSGRNRRVGQRRIKPENVVLEFCQECLDRRIVTMQGQRGARHLIPDQGHAKQPYAYELDTTGNIVWIEERALRVYMADSRVAVEESMRQLARYRHHKRRAMAEGISGHAGPARSVLRLDLDDPVWSSLKPEPGV